MGMVLNNGLMDLNLKVNLETVTKKAKEYLLGVTGQPIQVTYVKIISKGLVHTYGLIIGHMKDFEKIINWMVKEYLYEMIIESSQEPIKMIKKMEVVFSNGEMAEYLKGSG